jgi:hypothetical protein
VNEIGFPGHGGAGASNNDLVSSDADAVEPGTRPPETPPIGLVDNIAFSSGGLAVVWSEENSRDFLFDSMRRRETYGTSGPRMLVRFFGAWDHPNDMCSGVRFDPTGASLKGGSFVEAGYERGVPMGGNLPSPATRDAVPSFAVAALMDPGFALDDPKSDLFERSTPLQQIQIVKGWLDADGNAQETVVSVVGTPDNAAGVDLDTCEPHGAGAEDLCTVWRDDSFDPGQRAFYYARVVENPTCRWSWLQCRDYSSKNDVDWDRACKDEGSIPEGFRSCCLHEALEGGLGSGMKKRRLGTYPKTIQERAWTSPIWYTPRVN